MAHMRYLLCTGQHAFTFPKSVFDTFSLSNVPVENDAESITVEGNWGSRHFQMDYRAIPP